MSVTKMPDKSQVKEGKFNLSHGFMSRIATEAYYSSQQQKHIAEAPHTMMEQEVEWVLEPGCRHL